MVAEGRGRRERGRVGWVEGGEKGRIRTHIVGDFVNDLDPRCRSFQLRAPLVPVHPQTLD